MITLGVSDSHNAAAATISGTGALRALQEERPSRIKNYFDIPVQSIQWLLDQEGLKPADVEELALANLDGFPPLDRAGTIRNFRESGTWRGRLKNLLRQTPIATAVYSRRKREREQRYVALGFRPEQIRLYEHHECHAATAYYGPGVYDRPVLVITCDGAGDGLCSTVSIGRDGKLERLFSVDWSHSFAMIYAVVTYMTGMVPNEHEYKLMGMAPYAPVAASERIAGKLRDLFAWAEDGSPVWQRRPGVPHTMTIQPVLEKLFFEERFDAIMSGAQRFTESMMCELVRRAIQTTGIHDVAVAGGVFMNVKANKAIMEMAEVASLFVFPSCGDETTAIGAAYLARARRHGGHSIKPLNGFYLGPEWSEAEIRAAAEPLAAAGQITIEKPESINDATVDCLIAGEVVGRFSGPEEFGARSLGNRAILADPRNPGVIQVINEMVKSRDFWMPFASSMLAECANDYLVNPKNVAAPYMILSFDTTPKGGELLKAGIHPYDRTCRPQIVEAASNPQYWDLLNRFHAKTGVGGLVNTSLNLHGSPLVHHPRDALEVMQKSGLKRLVLGPLLITKIAA